MEKKGIIYLVRKRALGDVLWIEPIINELSSQYKKVVVISRFNDLFLNYPAPNVVFKADLLLLEKLAYHFERILGISFFFINLELSYEKKPKLHVLHAYQTTAKLPIKDVYPNLFLSETENIIDKELGKYVVLHIVSFTTKNYRKVFGIDWESVVSYLTQNGYKVVVVGDENNALPNTINFNKSIRQLISLIYNCSLFIGIDSGPSHIATSLKKSAIIFFGAVNPQYRHFTNLLNKTIIMQSACEFAGCYHEVTNSIYGQTCKLVGDVGVPKCSVHTTENLIININKILG